MAPVMCGARRIVLGIAIAVALAGTRAKAGEPLEFGWQPARASTRPQPLCFAYAPSLRAYACVGYLDDGGKHRRQVVDIVGIHDGWPRVETHMLPKDDVDRRLAEHGFLPGGTHRARLLPRKWIRAGAARVRYDWSVHEGDASYENLGDVTIRCRDGRDIPLGVRKRGLELGEDARVFWREDADVLAVSVAGDDGGEDTFYRWVNTVVVDVPVLCAGGTAAVAGPVQGRSVGP
ncbi:MAG TPA: hypothetical protein VIQ54_30555 [Polyangia bacterium]